VSRTLATAVLRRAGRALTVRSDPREAVDPDPSSFDMLVTDVVMPGLGGPALATKLRERRPELCVVFMTGFAERDAADQAAQLTVEPLLLKPFTPVVLMTAVRQALRSPGRDDRRLGALAIRRGQAATSSASERQEAARTTSTEQEAWISTLRATLPRSSRASPVWPRVPMTMVSILCAAA
jgi:CheY-like chemotaxis protein